MIDKETEIVLLNLAKIEKGLAKIYEYFSTIDHFPGPVKKFWSMMANEEMKHSDIFNNILSRAKKENDLLFKIKTDMEKLKSFVGNLNALLKDLKTRKISDIDAYSLGSRIEAELNEAVFLKNISTNDQLMIHDINKIDSDTKKHGMILINYSKGYK